MSDSQEAINKIESVALVGPPNAGKTTLYNWLTHSRYATVNYPGSTVDYSKGLLAEAFGGKLTIIDTPGTYSLFAQGADEEVTQKVLFSHEYFKTERVIVVVDGSQLARHLVLVQQIKESGFSMVIAVTMTDLLKKNNINIDLKSLEKEFSCPVVAIDGVLGGGVKELATILSQLKKQSGAKVNSWDENKQTQQVQRAEEVARKTLSNSVDNIYNSTARWDELLLHPTWGVFIFIGIMFLFFSSIFWLAAPFMEWVDQAFASVVTLASQWQALGALGSDFLAHGIIASFAAVLVFVPQIFILFLGIGFLESSGYLARAATLMDRPFSKLGMNGRSFVPILSGFACAVPAMMATRNIISPRDRRITNFVIPLMTCSARLPVYALLIGYLFVDSIWQAGFILTLIYFTSLLLGALAASVLNKILARNKVSYFMMELPLYRRPIFVPLVKMALQKTSNYVKKAGPAIFLFSVLIWMGTTFPNYQEVEAGQRLEGSYLAQAGKYIEPVFTPMGADWRVGVGLITAFAARETFVSTLAMLFNITEEDDTSNRGLMQAMAQAKDGKGQDLFNMASVSSLMIFFMVAMQCLSTYAVARKEESKKFALIQLFAFNFIAYALSVMVFQVLS